MVSTHSLLGLITMALASSKALAAPTPDQMKQYQVALDLHNQYRRAVNPVAGDMLKMTWDGELAEQAQKWADNCEFDYDPKRNTHKYDSVGQNIYVTNQLEDIVQDAVAHWASEIENYQYREVGTCPSQSTDCHTGHYTQMIWAQTYKLGMGVSSQRCPSGNYLVVANYAKAGNYHGEFPYKASSQPASACPPGSTQKSYPDNALCGVTDEAVLNRSIGLGTRESDATD